MMEGYILFLGGVLVGSLGTMISLFLYIVIGLKREK